MTESKPQWSSMQPMSQAPRDGTRVLAFHKRDNRFFDVGFDTSAALWTGARFFGDGYGTADLSGWYPLPCANPPDSSPIPPERVPEAPAQIMKRAAEIAGKEEAYYIDMSEDGRSRDDWSEHWDQKQRAHGAAAARKAILTEASRLEAELAAKGGAR